MRIHELPHLLEIRFNLLQALDRQPLIDLLQKWHVALEVSIEVANINKIAKYFWRKYQLEALSILFD